MQSLSRYTMTDTQIDVNESWENFKKERSFQKATSIQGQLDTMAAMLQEIQTDTKRTAGVIDQLQGDNAAIDYENANADPMAAMEEMGGAPPEDMPPEENVPMDGEAPGDETLPEDTPLDEPPADDRPPADIPSDLPADIPPMEDAAGAEDMLPPMPEAPAAGGVDMVSKIKDLIANTTDPQTLRGLSDLLTTALDQAPATPMESTDVAPPTLDGGMMKSEDVGTSDINDGLAEIKSELTDTVEKTLGEDMPGASEYRKAEDDTAEDAVETKMEDGPKPQTTEDFAMSEDSPEEEEPEVKAEVVVADEPVAEENPVVEEITEKVADAVEGIVESVLEGDKEPEGPKMPSMADLIDDDFGKSDDFEKAKAPEGDYQTGVVGPIDENSRKILKEGPEGTPLSEKGEVQGSFKECDDNAQVHAKFGDIQTESTKKAMDAGLHIPSIAEMIQDSQTSFGKSMDRPGIDLTYGHNPNRPSLTAMEGEDRIPSMDELYNEF